MHQNCGLPQFYISGAYPVGWSDLRGNSLGLLLPPFYGDDNLFPRCSHLLTVSIFPVSPETTSSCAGTASSSGSGGWVPSYQTPSEDQQHADYEGSGIGRCQRWGPLSNHVYSVSWNQSCSHICGPTQGVFHKKIWQLIIRGVHYFPF